MPRKVTPRPAADGISATVARLHQLADAAAASTGIPLAVRRPDGLQPLPPLPDGIASHPDGELLRLCEAVIHNRRKQKAIIDGPAPPRSGLIWTAPPHDLHQVRDRCAELRKLMDDGAQLMRRAGKLPARTLAGLYAKVIICRASSSGSPMLAKSLCRDMIALHPIVWPASAGEDV